MKRNLSVILIALLLTGGLGVLLYPTVSNFLAERGQTRAIQTYTQTAVALSDAEREEKLAEAMAYNALLTGSRITDPFVPGGGFVVPEAYGTILNVGGAIGYIEIPAIGVELPIYHGTSDEVLEKGVGHMEATAFPIGGAGNHSVLTGHSGLPRAELFTHLEDLELGDLFYITVLDTTLCYRVDAITVVEPTDTAALLPVEGEDYVTLVTCTPYGINSHRLFVRGTRTAYIHPGEEIAESGDDGGPANLLIAGGTAALALTAAASMVVRRKRRRR